MSQNSSRVICLPKLIVFDLIDCIGVKLLENYGIQCFRALDLILWALSEDNAYFVPFRHCNHPLNCFS